MSVQLCYKIADNIKISKIQLSTTFRITCHSVCIGVLVVLNK